MDGKDAKTSAKKTARNATPSLAADTAEWHKFDLDAAPRNCEVYVANKKNGARATVIVRGSEIFTSNGHRLPWEPDYICVPPEKLP